MEQMNRDRAQQQLDTLTAMRTAQDGPGKSFEKLHGILSAAAGHNRR